jgi:predicted PurR-regulated permease PerM
MSMETLDSANLTAPRVSNLARVASAVLTVAILWLGSELLIPIAFAGLLSFIVVPFVNRLTRRGIPNGLATSFVMSAVAALVLGIVLLTSSQALDLVTKLPEYRDTLVERIRNIRSNASVSMTELQATVATLDRELNSADVPTTESAATQAAAVETPVPVAVTVVERPDDFFTRVTTWATPVLGPLSSAGVVFFVAFFIVLGRHSLARKAFRLCVRLELIDAVDGAKVAGLTVARYLRAQLLVNVIYGTCLALIMLSLGLPNALMWGLLGALLRYIPYLGPLVAIAMPTLLSLAIAPGWTTPIITLTCLVVLEGFTNIVLETLFFGNSTGVSPLGVVLSFLFWGWVWGPAGLLLGMPITVGIVVIGRHVRPLRMLSDLLSADEEPAAQLDDKAIAPALVPASQAHSHQRIPDPTAA